MPLNFGLDASGNGNNWIVNNISQVAGSTYDSMLDVPSGNGYADGGNGRGNYATLNPLDKNAGTTPSNANLTWTASTPWRPARATFGMTTGKWYWEVTASGANCMVGIGTATAAIGDNNYPGKDANGWGYFDSNGNKFNNGSGSAYGASYTTNDVIGVAFDADSGTLTFYKNNASQGTAFTGLTSGPYFPMIGNEGSTSYHNFGQRPFSYTPPTGFKALNTTNLSDPTVKKGSSYFNPVLYTGDGSYPRTITGVGFQPDLVWTKARSTTYSHILYDAVRGTGTSKNLSTNETGAEGGNSTNANLTAFASDGFTVGTTSATNVLNNSGTTIVAWLWKANGSGVTNTAGTITSTVSANTTSGFSIATTTGTGGTGTIGHGLGAVPQFIMCFRRNTAADHYCYHQAIGNTNFLILNSTAASAASANLWNNTTPTSTVFSVGNTNNNSGDTYVHYIFAAIPGYSAFGSYTGNGSADGPFVYCGFRPRFIMFKESSGTNAATSNWITMDSSRGTYNAVDMGLAPNLSNAEFSSYPVDFLSNGYKIRTTNQSWNESGGTFIYAAFAENPLKFSNAR